MDRTRQPEAARRVARTIYDGCARLKDFPNLGRSQPPSGRRELTFAPLTYIVVYQVKPNAVEISRIFPRRAKLAIIPLERNSDNWESKNVPTERDISPVMSKHQDGE
jgi:plasmid stabilization system protein ParE